MRVAFVDFQRLPNLLLISINAIWLAIANRIADQLCLDSWNEDHRDHSCGYDRNTNKFFDRFVFKDHNATHVLLCFDEIERVFGTDFNFEIEEFVKRLNYKVNPGFYID